MKTNIRFWSYLPHFFLEWEVFQKKCKENRNTYFVFDNFFFENRTVYEIMWKNSVEQGKPQMTVWHMRIVCWIPKATKKNTHTHGLYNTRTHFFSTTTTFARTRLIVTLYLNCLSCLIYLKMVNLVETCHSK